MAEDGATKPGVGSECREFLTSKKRNLKITIAIVTVATKTALKGESPDNGDPGGIRNIMDDAREQINFSRN